MLDRSTPTFSGGRLTRQGNGGQHFSSTRQESGHVKLERVCIRTQCGRKSSPGDKAELIGGKPDQGRVISATQRISEVVLEAWYVINVNGYVLALQEERTEKRTEACRQ